VIYIYSFSTFRRRLCNLCLTFWKKTVNWLIKMHYYSHRYTSPTSQLVITALLTSAEVVINVSWLMYEPPSVTHSFPNRESRLLICEGLNDYSYMVGLIYPFFLIGNAFLHTPNSLKSKKYMSVVNPDPEMRSSGRVHNVYQFPSPQTWCP